ncbi:MAG TPA: flotillin-like protein FloA [bacterium]|nr:flotillin-like protein FloA [bacterium]
MVQFLIGLVVIVGVIFAIMFLYFLNIWVRAVASGAHISIFNLLGMKLRGISPALIVNVKIMAVKAGLQVETSELEAHHLARGNVMRVVQALIAADKANIPLDFKRGAAIDLAGRDILEAVHMSVIPKVIDAPDPSKGRPTVDAVAMDGVQLLAKARVTVRTNLERLVGGAGEDTIIARVGEGIVTTIGSAETHKKVLENPDLISQKVLAKGLDAGTAYEILSIDIADVDVGKNIGAELQQRRAEADLQIAKAKAEERRAMAVAREQEMKALVEEMRAKVVEAEAEIPKAMAYAFREGRLGVMDYYNFKNIQADTKMRESLAERPEKKEKK